MTPEMLSDDDISELKSAFRVFSDATATLEREYRALQAHARALTRDLAEKNRALEVSMARQRSLEAQALRQSRLAAMGEMAATLAHEVRNPLCAMELFVNLLHDEVRDRPTAARLAAQVALGIADLDHLVSNILEYTRLPEPKLVLTDLGGLLDEVLAASAPLLGDQIEIEFERPPDVCWPVDRGLLLQVLLNLLRNAAEALAGHGRLRLSITRAETMARIAIADSGPGIAPGNEEAIFAPFFTTKERGTGLGLAVSRAAISAHGGTLTLEHAHPGAIFVITLPATRDEASAGDQASA